MSRYQEEHRWRRWFFFSSRRLHTRLTCDWSSDVCSSDLETGAGPAPRGGRRAPPHPTGQQGFDEERAAEVEGECRSGPRLGEGEGQDVEMGALLGEDRRVQEEEGGLGGGEEHGDGHDEPCPSGSEEHHGQDRENGDTG